MQRAHGIHAASGSAHATPRQRRGGRARGRRDRARSRRGHGGRRGGGRLAQQASCGRRAGVLGGQRGRRADHRGRPGRVRERGQRARRRGRGMRYGRRGGSLQRLPPGRAAAGLSCGSGRADQLGK